MQSKSFNLLLRLRALIKTYFKKWLIGWRNIRIRRAITVRSSHRCRQWLKGRILRWWSRNRLNDSLTSSFYTVCLWPCCRRKRRHCSVKCWCSDRAAVTKQHGCSTRRCGITGSLFVCLLLNGTSALFRPLVPRRVEIKHTNRVKNDLK